MKAATFSNDPPEPTPQWEDMASYLLLKSSLGKPKGKHSSALGHFDEVLAPLTRTSFRQFISEVERQFQIVHQTLLMLEGQGFEDVLYDLLRSIALKLGELLQADRTTIFLLDRTRNELWSVVAEEESGRALEIRLPANRGIAGEVATRRQVINIPFDFYDDPRSQEAKRLEPQTGYRTYTLLALPLLDTRGELLAVVQMLNKLHSEDSQTPLAMRIDPQGFTLEDEAIFREFANSIRLILESAHAFYLSTQRQRAATALVKATQALSHGGLKLEDTLQRVMEEAKHLMEADRSTLWLLDRDRNSLWAKLPMADGTLQTIHVPVGQGYVGRVAETGKTLNIPYDVYQYPESNKAQEVDQSSGYRTYSLLCMPVFDSQGDLIGVTQLINKQRHVMLGSRSRTPTQASTPDTINSSFTQEDEFYMVAFNVNAGLVLEKAMLYANLEQKVIERTQELHEKNQQLEREIEERHRAEAALHQLNQSLKHIATIDALTQVANRRHFNESLQHEWHRLRREQQPLALIICDIDHFKAYNDAYGHPAGDTCLLKVAQAMQAQLKRPADLLARYGGEEFAIILPNTEAEGATYIAESLRETVLALRIEHQGSTTDSYVTLSLGVACVVPPLQGEPPALIKTADEALYRAKQQGRNRTVCLPHPSLPVNVSAG